MNEGRPLGISTKQQKRKTLLVVTLSLFVLQIIFARHVLAFSSNSNDKIINQTTAQSILSVALPVKSNIVIPVTGVTINKSSISIKKGGSETLKATLIPSNAKNKNVYWDSSNPAVAEVDLLKGKVKGLKVGTAIITVYTEDGNKTAVCNVNVKGPDDLVTFKDANLEKAVRDSIDKETGDLLKSDVKKITTLDTVGMPINDLSGIENLTNLRRLNLGSDSNQISDISNLKGLTNLTSLHLGHNQIKDLDALKNLINLTNLSLSGNQINDITPLERLTKLTSLNISENQVVDIITLKQLTKLKNLYLDQNQISNINPLKVSTKLRYLDLSQNPLAETDKKSLRRALPKCKIIF